MKVNAHTSDDGLKLEFTISGPEIREGFKAAFDDYRMKDLLLKMMANQTGPLGQAIAEQVKISIDAPVTQMTMQTAINRGLAAAVTEVEKRIGEAAIRATEGALGRFLASTFSRLRKALDSE